MFERFTGESRQVVVSAQEAARELLHHHIGTEHLLLALIGQESSPVRRALIGLGIVPGPLTSAVLELVPNRSSAPPGHIPFTPRAKKVLELSLREALSRGDEDIRPEHLMLGLLREGSGTAAQVLQRDGRTLEEIRAAVVQAAGAGTAPSGGLRTPAAEQVLATAERLAAGAPVGSHHLLEALVSIDSGVALQVLTELGVTPETLTERLDATDLTGTGDSTPEQAAAAGMTWAVSADAVTLTSTDPALVEQVRRLVDEVGGPLTGNGVLAGPFIALHQALQTAAGQLAEGLVPPSTEQAGRLPSLLERLRNLRRPS